MAERDQVGRVLWSHVRIVVEDPPNRADPPYTHSLPPSDHVMVGALGLYADEANLSFK